MASQLNSLERVNIALGIGVNTVLFRIFGIILTLVFEVMKFSVVLLLVYMIGMAIFYMNDYGVSLSGTASPRKSFINDGRSNSYANLPYPFVIELPSKSSIESPRGSKTKRPSNTMPVGSGVDVPGNETDDEIEIKSDNKRNNGVGVANANS